MHEAGHPKAGALERPSGVGWGGREGGASGYGAPTGLPVAFPVAESHHDIVIILPVKIGYLKRKGKDYR